MTFKKPTKTAAIVYPLFLALIIYMGFSAGWLEVLKMIGLAFSIGVVMGLCVWGPVGLTLWFTGRKKEDK